MAVVSDASSSDGEQLAGHGPDVFLGGRVDTIAPLAGLEIEIVPTVEGASGQKVVLDERERTFDACGTVGVAALMSHEAEAETLGKGGHLRHRNHLTPGAAQHHHVRVVE